MELQYIKAGIDDLNLLTATRIQVLRAANQLSDDTAMPDVEEETRKYYQYALPSGEHTAILVFDGERFVGAGGVSYYTVMPTFHNPTGRKAYIMNMYTVPQYRRRGIARRTMEILLEDIQSHGITQVSLEATAMGRPLYEKMGFIPLLGEMMLPEKELLMRIST